jgi:hypothetical protein
MTDETERAEQDEYDRQFEALVAPLKQFEVEELIARVKRNGAS